MKFKKTLLATLLATMLSPVVMAQNIGFEDGTTTGWTGNGISAVSQQVLQAGTNQWTINPYGSYMGKLTITTGTFSQMATALDLTSTSTSGIQTTLSTQATATGNGQGTPTTASWTSKTVTLTAGQQFTLAWQYISTDYVPFNDGSIATLVKVGDPTVSAVLNNYTSQYALLGYTNPGTGDYSTGSYGSTGWQTATYNVTASGDYLLGFGVFNLDDTALSPVLFVDEVVGTTMLNGTAFGAVAPNPGTSAPDTSGGTVTPPVVPPVVSPVGPTLVSNVTGTTGSDLLSTGNITVNGGTIQIVMTGATLTQLFDVQSSAMTVDQNSNTATLSGVISGSGDVVIANGGTGGSVTFTAINTYTGATTINQGATLINNGSIASSSGVTNNGTFTNNSQAPGVTNTGTFTNATTGTAVSLTNSGAATNDGTITGSVTNTGTFTNTGIAGDVINSGTATNSGTVSVITNTGAFTNNGIAGDVTTSGIFDNAGTAGNIANTGTFTNNGFVGNITNQLNSTVTNNNTAGTVNNSGTFNNAGTITTVTNTGTLTNTGTSGAVTNSGTVSNSGTVGNVTNTAGTFTNTGSAGNITNAGTTTNSGSTGNVTNSNMFSNLVNGIINSLTNSGTASNVGTVTTTVTNTGTFTNTGTTGDVTNSSTASNSGTVGNVTNTAGTFDNTGTAGNIANAGTVNNTGTIGTISNTGWFTNAINAVAGYISNSGTATNNGAVSSVNNSGDFVNNGTVTTGSVYNSGTFTNNGTAGEIGNAGTFTNNGTVGIVSLNTGTFNNAGTTGDMLNEGTVNNTGTIGIILNAGTLNNSGTTGDWLNELAVINSGTMGNGTNIGTYSSTGTVGNVSNIGKLDTSGQGGLIVNSGEVTMTDGNLVGIENTGKFTTSGGTLGAYTQTKPGTTVMFAGKPFTVTGAAQLGGGLTINSSPTTYGKYSLLSAGSVDGKFDTFTSAGVNDYLKYSGNDVKLYVTPNATATQSSISNAVGNLSSMNSLQSSVINNSLGNDCNMFGTTGGCVSANFANTAAASGDLTSGGLTLGKRIDDNWKAGVFLNNAFNNPTIGGVAQTTNPAIGGFVGWNQNANGTGFGVQGSIVSNSGKMTVTRSGPEIGVGTATTAGQALQLKGTYAHALTDKTTLTDYIGVRQTKLNVSGYNETGPVFPLTVNSTQQTTTDLLVGVGGSHKFSDKLTANVNAGIVQNLTNSGGNFSGTSEIGNLQTFNTALPTSKYTSAALGAGVSYNVGKDKRIGASVGWQQKGLTNADITSYGLNYTAGF